MEKVTFSNNIAHKKGKTATVCSLQVCPAFSASVSCRQWSPGNEKAVAFGPGCVCAYLHLCVCMCVCAQTLTPPQGVETTSSGGSQGYFQPADISDNL